MKSLARISNFSQAICLSLLLLTALSVSSFAQADTLGAWTSVGSFGIVDEADAAKVGFNATQVYLLPGADSATIRYNVTATPNLFFGLTKTLSARIFKPNADSKIVMDLVKQDLKTGTIVGIGGLDSSMWTTSLSFQVRSTTLLQNQFDFSTCSYYLEVKLSRSAPTGDPRISMLQILGK